MKDNRTSTIVLLLIIVIVFGFILVVLNPFKDTVTVTFDPRGGEMEVEEVTIEKKTKVEKPEDPIKEGYEFIGWKKDGEYFDFTSILTKDIELYAEYKEVINATDLLIQYNDITLNVDESIELGYTLVPSNSNEQVKIEIEDEYIVKLSNGKIVALNGGSTTITLSVKAKEKVINVTVIPGANYVELSATSLDVVKGKSEKLTATVHPSDAYDQEIIWKSSNEVIATVDSEGNVKGLSGGRVTITASTKSGISGTCTVRVLVYPTNLRFTKTEYYVSEGESVSSEIKFEPEDSNVVDVYYTSEDTSLDINGDGVIYANSFSKEGVKIYATMESGKFAESIVYIKGEGIDFNNKLENLLVFPGCSIDVSKLGGISFFKRTGDVKTVDQTEISLSSISFEFSDDGENFSGSSYIKKSGNEISFNSSSIVSPKEIYMRLRTKISGKEYISKAYKIYVEPKLTYELDPTYVVTYGSVSGVSRTDKISGVKKNDTFTVSFDYPAGEIKEGTGANISYTRALDGIYEVSVTKTSTFGQGYFTVITYNGQEVIIQF